MKLITTILAAAGLLVTSTVAGQSDPFYLVLHSDNSTLDGKALFSGHEGAGIEGLLVGVESPPPKADNISYTYQYNTTDSQPNIGILTWEITVNGGSLSSKFNASPLLSRPPLTTSSSLSRHGHLSRCKHERRRSTLRTG